MNRLQAESADVLRRCARTFLQSFVAVLIAAGAGVFKVSVLAAAATAGGAGVLALVQRLLDPVVSTVPVARSIALDGPTAPPQVPETEIVVPVVSTGDGAQSGPPPNDAYLPGT